MGRAGMALAVIALFAADAHANTATFDNGGTGPGKIAITFDDYGAYGLQLSSALYDVQHPPGYSTSFVDTQMAGLMVFMTTPDQSTYSVLLTDYKGWATYLEKSPPQPDGIVGPLTRMVMTGVTATGNQATSSFRVADTNALGIQLDFDLVQTLSSDPSSFQGDFHQAYTIHNNGTTNLSLVVHGAWEADLWFVDGSTSDEYNDIVGVGPGLCGPYQREDDPFESIALGNGASSTVPMYGFYAGKQGQAPGGGQTPTFTYGLAAVTEQWVWIDHGMPDTWRDFVVGPGAGAVGESLSTYPPTGVKNQDDATIGIEYRFDLPAGATETIELVRYYGYTTVPCFVSKNCGNGVIDAGELCDGADTADCNGATCSASVCGDGHVNTVAGESCDSMGIDTADCNGAACSAPACGDGYANAAAGEACDDGGESAACNADCTLAACGDGVLNQTAGEQCEGGALCDPSCRVTYRLGGGCAGCGAGGDAGAPLLFAVVFAFRRRRRIRRSSQAR